MKPVKIVAVFAVSCFLCAGDASSGVDEVCHVGAQLHLQPGGAGAVPYMRHVQAFVEGGMADYVLVAMQALNAFWRRRVPGLQRTAGYPADARRFKADIASAQAALGIDDRTLVRAR